MSDAEQYNEGGFIPGGPVWTLIHPNECLIRPDADGRLVCGRPGHPTSTSDCRPARV